MQDLFRRLASIGTTPMAMGWLGVIVIREGFIAEAKEVAEKRFRIETQLRLGY